MRLSPGGRQQARGRVPCGRAVVPDDPEKICRAAGRSARPRPGNARLGHPAAISTSPSDSARAASRARLPLPRIGALCACNALRPDPSGSNALTVFTSGDGMATPRSGRGLRTGTDSALRACIPSRHPQTPRVATGFGRLSGDRAATAATCGVATGRHGGPTRWFRPYWATATRKDVRPGARGRAFPTGNSAARHRSSRRARSQSARDAPQRDSSSTGGVTGATDALSVSLGQRPPASAHSATRRTTVSGWSVRKKCSPGRISSRKPALV